MSTTFQSYNFTFTTNNYSSQDNDTIFNSSKHSFSQELKDNNSVWQILQENGKQTTLGPTLVPYDGSLYNLSSPISSNASMSWYNISNATNVQDHGHCSDWKEIQHSLFQLANLCFVISFLMPSNLRLHGYFLRMILSIGYIFLFLWAGLFICMLDILCWSCAFLFVNFIQIIYLSYKHFPSKFPKELSQIYAKIFKPFNMSGAEFNKLARVGVIQTLREGSTYAREGLTPVGEKISILVKGRLKVRTEQVFLHDIDPLNFLDSPEYDANRNNPNVNHTFQVTLIACEDSTILTWHVLHLNEFFENHLFLANVFSLVVGKDISNKMYQIQELLSTNPSYMHSSSRHSSVANLRSTIASNSSDANINHALSCFNLHFKGSSSVSSNFEQAASPSKSSTFESRV